MKPVIELLFTKGHFEDFWGVYVDGRLVEDYYISRNIFAYLDAVCAFVQYSRASDIQADKDICGGELWSRNDGG